MSNFEKPVLVGGVGEINFGKQYRQGNRVYDSEAIAMCLNAQPVGNAGGNSYLYLVNENSEKGSDKLTNINEVFEGKPFKYVSLFSGIGGFEQALNKLGGTCVMASEIDPFANKAYEVLYGRETVGDVTKVAAENVPEHNLLVGGFPCPTFSVAGGRDGMEYKCQECDHEHLITYNDYKNGAKCPICSGKTEPKDERGLLFFEIARIAETRLPKALLLENVKGLVSSAKGEVLRVIVETLNDIGYTVDFEVLNSKYFGVPQNRERIFIVAIRDDLVQSTPWVIGKRTDVVAKGKRRISALAGVKTFNFDYPAQKEVTMRLRDVLEENVDERYYLSEEKTTKLVAQLEGMEFTDNNEPDMVGRLEMNGHDILKRVYSPNGVGTTLTTMGGGNTEPKIAEEVRSCSTRTRTYAGKPEKLEVRKDSVSNTITSVPKDSYVLRIPRYRIRKLTPRECFRLQGFSDESFDKLTANGISNSQLYKMAGNAVTVNVIDAIGKRLLPYLEVKSGVK